MTYGQLEQKVRDALKDTRPDRYRWASYYIMRSLLEGVMALHKLNPASRYAGLKLVHFEDEFPSIESDDDVTEDFRQTKPFTDMRWSDAIFYYALGKCYEIDGQDEQNAMLMQNAFTKFDSLARM